MVGATFREGFPEEGTFGLTSGKKSIQAEGTACSRVLRQGQPGRWEGLKEYPARLECRERGEAQGKRRLKKGADAGPCQGHRDCVEASGLS